MNIKGALPWWAKIGGKIVLSRVPARYRVWQRLNLFIHGEMDSPEYALRVVRSHLNCINWPNLSGRTVIEIGPGDSVATAVIAKALGAHRTILVDAGAFATNELAPYHALADLLRREGLTPPDLDGCTTLDEVLSRCNASYLTDGLASLRSIPDGVADLVFSQAVLEHVRRDEMASTLRETLRVMKSDGIASHEVDLKDHLGGALNNLRFPDSLWEADWFARSGFYTNRLRFGELCALFESSGFDLEVVKTEYFSSLPSPRGKLNKRFRLLPDEDLLVSNFHALLRPRKS